MDYCYSCRRNLNGALVCPGCGAYAPDIAPPAHRLHSSVATPETTRQAWDAEDVPAPEPRPGTPKSDAAPTGSGACGDTTADAYDAGSSSGHEGTDSTGQGRAARRRQLARWKKNKRRAVAATAVALVGGGLTVAALPTTRPSSSHTHAASPPDPVTAPTPGTAATDSASEQPDTPGSRHPSTRPPRAAGGQQDTTAATPRTAPAAATTGRQPKTAARVQPLAPPVAPPSAADPAPATPAGNAAAPAPETTAPASAERPGAGTTTVNLLPTTSTDDPTSPAQVCLIALCIG
ncbi:SCO2400 family protein [Streptomyces sp.]|uniref:SCO2400 family protein n=1 Tax=Streptomyces sp. TaxID=1931 RepID=UPI003BEED2FE